MPYCCTNDGPVGCVQVGPPVTAVTLALVLVITRPIELKQTAATPATTTFAVALDNSPD